MALNWAKWGKDYWASLARHIGTAGLAWLGIGLGSGHIDWHSLWYALVTGAFLPTTFTFFQNTPIPEELAEIKTTQNEK